LPSGLKGYRPKNKEEILNTEEYLGLATTETLRECLRLSTEKNCPTRILVYDREVYEMSDKYQALDRIEPYRSHSYIPKIYYNPFLIMARTVSFKSSKDGLILTTVFGESKVDKRKLKRVLKSKAMGPAGPLEMASKKDLQRIGFERGTVSPFIETDSLRCKGGSIDALIFDKTKYMWGYNRKRFDFSNGLKSSVQMPYSEAVENLATVLGREAILKNKISANRLIELPSSV
jgi:hypothetical protein